MISLEAPEGISDINKTLKKEKDLFYIETVRLFSDVCKRGDVFHAKQLLDSYENLTNDQDEEFVLPLHWAALNNHLQLCQYLLISGSFVNAKCNRDMSTALHWAASNGNCSIGLLLIENGADFTLFDGAGYAPIHIACQRGHSLFVSMLIELDKTLVDQKDSFGRSPLIWACYKSHRILAKLLLKLGARFNEVDNSGVGALHWTVISETSDFEIAKSLLKAGSDPNIKDDSNRTVLDWVKIKKRDWFYVILEENSKSKFFIVKRLIGLNIFPHLVCPLIFLGSYFVRSRIAALLLILLVLYLGKVTLSKYLARGKRMIETGFLLQIQYHIICVSAVIYFSNFMQGIYSL
jgi:ankyrin repeat protein